MMLTDGYFRVAWPRLRSQGVATGDWVRPRLQFRNLKLPVATALSRMAEGTDVVSIPIGSAD